MGVTLDQIGEQGWISLLSPEDRERSVESWNNALRTGESFQTESSFKTRDGSKRWYHCRAIPVRDSSGRIVRWFGSCSDIHDQKIAAECPPKQQGGIAAGERSAEAVQYRL
ncbi:MAG: PAS domain-containing protein [Bryobacterales bacterium]|nr:PAS domain-containing protein [Bryobacterales bacterium]